MAVYEFVRIKDANSNGIQNMVKTFNTQLLSEVERSGYSLYGIFFGLLGLASNELYLASFREDHGPSSNETSALSKLIERP